MSTATTTLICTRHPQRETLLRCSKCEQPFCVDCMVQTPVGFRCYACAGVKRSSAPAKYGRALVGAMAVAAGTSALSALGSRFGLLLAIILAVVAGAGVGRLLGPLANRRTRPRLIATGALTLIIGGVLGRVLIVLVLIGAAASRSGVAGVPIVPLVLQTALTAPLDLGFWLFVGIAGFVAYRRLV